MYGYTYDEVDHLIEPMAEQGKDPVGSMGDDTPLSVLSDFDRPLFTYFKQLFAQVTNPPLDYIREELVTSLESRLGPQRNLLDESRNTPANSFSTHQSLRTRRRSHQGPERQRHVHEGHRYHLQKGGAFARPSKTCGPNRRRSTGTRILVLSDRAASEGRVPIPSLLAVGGIHHHLVRNGLRNHVGLVVESGDPRAVHHFATLIGYGAGAVNPYLAYQTIEDLVAGPDGADLAEAIEAYITAVENGVLKTMAKMGISTIASYQGAQIFEAVGLYSDFIAEYFEGTTSGPTVSVSRLCDDDLDQRHDVDLERARARSAATGRVRVPLERHPPPVEPQHGRQDPASRTVGDYDTYKEFAELVNDQSEELQTLRGLFEFDSDREPIPIEDVEPVDDIVERFETAAMSLGSLSSEMHENNAIAMNRSGQRQHRRRRRTARTVRHRKGVYDKQVASGRFGVTADYLASADELQIKMAQGSKPGEGGHLPGKKVNEMIAHVRFATPGVGLISPPPLHDIYSIEDLKQLIHDLKAANPEADINVKLVSEDGIGTIAAGVAKANADVVHISGHDGGTGASPKTSIKNAGLPWELGVSEANQMLRATGLRSRIKVTTDGGMKTGRDVAVAALLGAEEYVFGTASLVTSGCVMARQCHENTCPVGVATQRDTCAIVSPANPARHQLHDVRGAGTPRDHGRTRLRDYRRDDRPTERTQAARRREPAQGPEARPLGRHR